MAPFDTKITGLLIDTDDSLFLGPDSAREGKAQSGKKESIDTKEYRKKKKDAHEGKEDKEAKGESDSEDEGHHAADKAEGGEGGHDNNKEGGEKTKGGGGTQSGQGLQSGQTTVQFSSGGGAGNANMASSLASLMGLFSSSAGLARVEGGSALTASAQSASLSSRAASQASSTQASNLFNAELKIKGNVGEVSEQVVESTGSAFKVDTGGSMAAHSSSTGSQDIFSQLINNVSTQAGQGTSDQGSGNTITVTTSVGAGVPIITTFNTGNFFFSSQTPFVFTNSASPYIGMAGTYLQGAGIPTSSSYSYQLASPLASGGSGILTSGITFNTGVPPSALYLDISTPPNPLTAPPPTGLTLTASGDLYANVTSPISVVVDIISGTQSLPVRIDAGPGPLVTTANSSGVMVGSVQNGQFQNTVLSDSVGYTMVGTDTDLSINSSTSPGLISTSGLSFGIPSTGTYSFPSNTLYRHVGTTLQTVPTQAAYGNFDNAPGSGNIYLPNAPSVYTLTMGGNVLDVYGTKYGVANTLDVFLPSNSAPAGGAGGQGNNTLTMGGNTLAGFGTSYGDLQTLTVSAQSGNSATTLGPTDLIFRGNDLAVDKSIDSILYPHLQTLDMQEATSTSSPPSLPANVNMSFQDSLVQGNAGNDTFYGDIQNLSNLTSTTSYGGFLAGVTVTNVNGQVMTTTTDGSNNSIAWGNNVYIGGGGNNTYNFTLLEDAATQGTSPNKAVMQGNALLTDFNLSTDKLNFQISPTLFRALDGADGQGHNKQITVGDLNASVTFSPLSLSTIPNDPLWSQYVSATSTGTTITFDKGVGGGGGGNTNGGSISLLNDTLTGFADIHNLTTNISLLYAPIAALPPNPTVVSTPRATGPFVYGEGAGTLHTGLYYNELDNFFSNSLLATYQISGVASSADSLTPGTPTAIQYDIAPGVIIDQYGTISVDATVTTPTLISLTITGTDQQGATASINQFFGFLNAPITVIADGGTTVGAIGSGANIITGGVGSTLIGESMSSPILTISNSNSTPFIGSNLIVDTAGKATVYGDFQSISFIAQGDSNTHLSNPSNDGNISQPIGQSQPLNFGANAVYAINAAAICGVTPTFDITAQGGLNDDVGSGGLFGGGGGGFSSYSATGNFTNNTFTFGSETIYGSIENVSGVDQSIYGNMQGFNISSIAGSGASLHGGGGSVSLDLSSHVDNNMFTFGPVQIIVQGDVSGQTTNLYPNLKYLSITVEPTSSQSSDGNLTLTTDATFSGNSFVFGNDTLKGGAGKTNFYADIDLTKNTSPYAYNGFISGVTTSTSNGVLTTTTSDNLHNAITWGNNTFIGGTGTNTYNFTLLYNPDGAYASGVDSHGVFTGFDTITNFRPLTDVLTFTVAPNLYKEVLTATGTSSFSAADLNTLATFTNSNGNTIISFNSPSGEGNGSLTLDNVTLTSFAQFSHLVINSANVNATINTGAAFDPVFAKGTSAQSLSAFVNLPPNATATYSATGVTYNSTSVTSGIGVNSNGTIGVSTSLSAPVDATITGIKATITEGGTTTTLNLPDVHVFASNAASVTRDTTSPTISGSPAAAAYEVTADTVYGGGGDIALSSTPLPTYQSKLIDNISTTTHTVYGDVQNITYDGSTTVTGKTFTFKPNLINVNMGTAGADQVFGNAQNLTLSLPSGATTTFSNNTTLNFGSNTIYGSGTLYGDIQTITLNNLSQNANTVIQANFNFGSNTLTGGTYLSYENTVTSSATPTTLYGDVGSLSITGAGAIMSGNIFTFGQNTLTGSQGGSSLYAGVGQLTIENTQAGGQISANHLTFGNSTLTGVGDGLTKFYGDINDLSQTNFYNYDVTATTSSGHVQITDTVGAGTFDSTVLNNIITFGNDTMVGSSTGTSVFNIDLFAATNGSIVGEGNTTITNFGASNANILNLHLSQALYDDILAANGIPSSSTPVPITGAMLDAYYTLNPHDNITQSGGNTLVNFSDGTANNSNFGSITLEGVSVNSFASLGTNLQITADGITTIDPPPSSSNVYHVDVPGADISSATQNTHIVDVSTLGHIVDFGGTLDLGMSNALFKALGLSDANTAAQNLQILQNDANTATGGIAVSTNTTGTGANAVTNTILTFESTTNGVVNTYGSVTLHDTHFNPADPLSAHLQVTHH